jgi:hypothetical protein
MDWNVEATVLLETIQPLLKLFNRFVTAIKITAKYADDTDRIFIA